MFLHRMSFQSIFSIESTSTDLALEVRATMNALEMSFRKATTVIHFSTIREWAKEIPIHIFPK